MNDAQTPMRTVDEMLGLIYRHLVDDGWYEETLDVFLPVQNMRPLAKRDLHLLAEHRALMLRLGYPLETVAFYNR